MKTRPEVRIDRTKMLAEEPGTGHKRWHPDRLTEQAGA
jgi:hypothetical protein